MVYGGKLVATSTVIVAAITFAVVVARARLCGRRNERSFGVRCVRKLISRGASVMLRVRLTGYGCCRMFYSTCNVNI